MCRREQALAKPNLDERSLSSCAAAGSIWSPGVDRFYPSLLTEIHLAREIIEEFAMSVVNEMILSMENSMGKLFALMMWMPCMRSA